MYAIWKYELNGKSWQSFDMPRGARVIAVRMQGSTPVLYAMVNPEQPMEAHEIVIHGTGHEITPEEMVRYVGTFQDDWYVGHVFHFASLSHEHQA